MYKIDFYITCGYESEHLINAVKSVVGHEKSDRFKLNITVINNTGKPWNNYIGETTAIYNTPVRFTMAQLANYIMRQTIEKGMLFSIAMHDDAVMNPGAIDALLDKYEEVKDQKWVTITAKGSTGVLAMGNVAPYIEDNIWWDTYLFPMYYVDLHYYRMVGLKGWKIFETDRDDLIEHIGSNSLKSDPIMAERNRINSKYSSEIYKDIWGGLPGEETTDKCEILGQ
jgi:hypothetical protein